MPQKLTFYFFIFLIQLIGVAILGFSLLVYFESHNYVNFQDTASLFDTPFILIMALGAIMTLVGFLGCCGAIRESTCLLGTVSIILVYKKKTFSLQLHALSILAIVTILHDIHLFLINDRTWSISNPSFKRKKEGGFFKQLYSICLNYTDHNIYFFSLHSISFYA